MGGVKICSEFVDFHLGHFVSNGRGRPLQDLRQMLRIIMECELGN